jgi:hypothetical protein
MVALALATPQAPVPVIFARRQDARREGTADPLLQAWPLADGGYLPRRVLASGAR